MAKVKVRSNLLSKSQLHLAHDRWDWEILSKNDSLAGVGDSPKQLEMKNISDVLICHEENVTWASTAKNKR